MFFPKQMNNYDFLILSASEFERLTRDLLQKHLGCYIESFTSGRDGGIDLRCAGIKDSSTIIQCKRYKEYSSEKHCLARWAYRRIFKNTYVILLAKELYPDIQKYVLEKNIYYCPNGIPQTNLDGYKRTSVHTPYTFLFLSNMIETKGVVELLKACSVLSKKGVIYTCNFVGKWSTVTEERFYDFVKEFCIEENVNYLGAKYNEDKISELRNADSLVFPTYYPGECFPLVLIEAMEYSLPCISTIEGGIPSLINDGGTGFLVQSKDTDALADKMLWLIEHQEEGLLMGKKGRNRFLDNFTLDIFEHRMIDILSAVIKAKNNN